MERLTETRIDSRDTSFTERQEIHYTVKKEKKFKAFDKLGKLENLEEQVGCPIETRLKLCTNNNIYDKNGNAYCIQSIGELGFIVERINNDTVLHLLYKDYEKTWWLKADKSE